MICIGVCPNRAERARTVGSATGASGPCPGAPHPLPGGGAGGRARRRHRCHHRLQHRLPHVERRRRLMAGDGPAERDDGCQQRDRAGQRVSEPLQARRRGNARFGRASPHWAVSGVASSSSAVRQPFTLVGYARWSEPVRLDLHVALSTVGAAHSVTLNGLYLLATPA